MGLFEAQAPEYDARQKRELEDLKAADIAWLAESQTIDPERQAEILKLSAATGMKASLVATNFDLVKRRLHAQQIDPGRVVATNPALAAMLADPELAPMVRDDVAKLDDLAWFFKVPGAALAGGMEQAHYQVDTLQKFSGLNTTANEADVEYLKKNHMARDYGARSWLGKAWQGLWFNLPTFPISIGGRVAGTAIGTAVGGGAGIETGPGAVVTAGAGAIAGEYAGGATVDFLQMVGPLYQQMLDLKDEQGNQLLSDDEARAYAFSGAATASAITGALDRRVARFIPGVDALLAKVAGVEVKKTLTKITLGEGIKTFSKETAKNVATGAAAVATMNAINAATMEAAQINHGTAQLDLAAAGRVGTAALEGLRQGFTDMALLSALHPALDFYKNVGWVRTSQENFAKITAMTDTVEGAKLRLRSPQLFEKYLGRLKQEGEGATHLFWAVDDFDKAAAEQKLEPRAIAAEIMGDGGSGYDQAKANGGDISVPIEQGLARLAQTKEGLALVARDARLDQKDLSGRQLEALQAKAKKLAELAPEAMSEPQRRILDDWKKRWEGKTSPDDAEATGRQLAAFYEVMAGYQKDRTTSWDLYERTTSKLTTHGPKDTAGAPPDAKVAYLQSAIGLVEQKLSAITPAAAARDLTEHYLKASPADQARIYYVDPKTGLHNDRALWDAPADPEKPLFAQVQISGKKAANDKHGHDTVDRTFRAVGKALLEAGGDHVAKVGGDIMFRVKDAAEAQAILKAARAKLPAWMELSVGVGQRGESLRATVDGINAGHGSLVEAARKAGTFAGREAMPATFQALGKSKGKKAYGTALAALSPDQAQVQLSPELQAAHAQLDPRTAAEKAYRTEGGLLTAAGWAARRAEGVAKKHVASADLRKIARLNGVFGTEATDRILLDLEAMVRDAGGAEFDAAHLSGDEFSFQHDDLAKLEAFKAKLKAAGREMWYRLEDTKDGSILSADGLELAVGVGRTWDEADGAALAADKQAIDKQLGPGWEERRIARRLPGEGGGGEDPARPLPPGGDGSRLPGDLAGSELLGPDQSLPGLAADRADEVRSLLEERSRLRAELAQEATSLAQQEAAQAVDAAYWGEDGGQGRGAAARGLQEAPDPGGSAVVPRADLQAIADATGTPVGERGEVNAGEVLAVLGQTRDWQGWFDRFSKNELVQKHYTPEALEAFRVGLERTAAMFGDFSLVPPELGESPIRGNSDPLFKVTFDVTTICPRQDAYVSTVYNVERKLGHLLNPYERHLVGIMLKDEGIIPPCWFCYGQAGRNAFDLAVGKALTIARDYVAVRQGVKKPAAGALDGVFFKAGQYDWNPKASWRGFLDANWKALAAKGGMDEVRIRDIIRGEATAKDAHEQQLADATRALAQSVSKGNKPKGFGSLKEQLFRIADEKMRRYNAIAGIRMNSQTDFRPWHFLEVSEFLGQLAARSGLAHVYTKEADFVRAFGATGVKFNLSLSYATDKAGRMVVEAGGRPVFDSVRGMAGEDATALRAQYPRDVGGMLVALNDEQLLAGLVDGRVDMMIPYHAGTVPGAVDRAEGARDYSNWQHEHWPEGTKKGEKITVRLSNGKKVTVEGLLPITRAHHFNDAKLYLELCEKLGVTPKFANVPSSADPAQLLPLLKWDGKAKTAEVNPEYMKLVRDVAREPNNQVVVDPLKIDFTFGGSLIDKWRSAGGDTAAKGDPALIDRVMQRIEMQDWPKGVVDADGKALVQLGARPRADGEPVTRLEGAQTVLAQSAELFAGKDQGYILFSLPDGTGEPRRFEIHRLRGANRSTLAHETAHFMLEVLSDLAGAPSADPTLRAQYDGLVSWMGYASHDERLAAGKERVALGAAAARDAGQEARLKKLTANEERFAYGWEQWLAEGKAPSKELEGVFARFSSWLRRIYRVADAIGAKYEANFGEALGLTDDVRGIFKRLLATEDAIAAADKEMEAGSFTPLLDRMTPTRRAEYEALREEERREKEAELFRMASESDLSEGRKMVGEDRARLTTEVEAELEKEPVYRAIDFLQRDLTPESSVVDIATGRLSADLVDEHGRPWKLDRKELVQAYGEDYVKTLPRGALAREGGVPADFIAERLGFGSGDEMLKAIQTAKDRKAVLAAEVQARLEAIYGKALIDDPTKLAAAALDAAHSPADARRILFEIQELARAVNAEAAPSSVASRETLKATADRLVNADPAPSEAPAADAFVNKGTTGDARRLDTELYKAAAARAEDLSLLERQLAAARDAVDARKGKATAEEEARVNAAYERLKAARDRRDAFARLRGITVEHARAAARDQVSRLLVGDLNPSYYLDAEKAAARRAIEAAAQGDLSLAADEKETQLLNWALFREASKAKAEAETITGRLARFTTDRERAKLGKAGGEYLPRVDSLLGAFELKTSVTPAEMKGRQSMLAWLEVERAAGREPVIPDSILEKLDRSVSWRELTIGDLRDLSDSVESIVHQAKLKNTLMTSKGRRERAAAKAELINALTGNLPVHDIIVSKNTVPYLLQKARIGKRLRAGLVKPEELLREMDGGQIDGPWSTYLWNPVNDSTYAWLDLADKTAKPVRDAIQALPKEDMKRLVNTRFKLAGQTWTMEEALVVALNWGNESNAKKLLEGWSQSNVSRYRLEGWTADTVEAFLSKLNRKDWELVQQVWGQLETLWPEMAALEKRLTGLEPPRVKPRPFTRQLADGTTIEMQGGYYPVSYDPRFSRQGARQEEKTSLRSVQLFDPGYYRASTPTGHLQARIEEFARPLALSLDALPKHVTEASKDIAMRESLLSVHDILTDGDVRAAMLQTIGEDGIKVLDGWLRDSANDLVIPDGGAGAIINFSNKARTGFTGMVFSFNVAQMLQNFANAANAFDAVPVKFLGSGLARLAKDRSAAIQEMHDLSATMKQRSTSFERDIGDSLRALRGQEGVLARTREVGLWGMQVVDQVVAVPTFWGAFEHAIASKEEGGLGLSKDLAVRHAEQTVRLRMGSGLTKDLAAVMRDPRAKFLTMFMGFANGQLNQLFAAHADASLAWSQGDRYRALRRLTKTYFWVALMGTVASELFTGRSPKEEDEEGRKRWGKWAVTKAAMAPVMWVPLLGQVAKAAESGRDASITPYAQLFTTTAKATAGAWRIGEKALDEDQEVSVEELTKAGLNIVEAAATWNGLPVSQAKATVGYWNDPNRNESASVPEDVIGSLYGKQRKGRLNEAIFGQE
jgi:GGDEF domain-containing protein